MLFVLFSTGDGSSSCGKRSSASSLVLLSWDHIANKHASLSLSEVHLDEIILDLVLTLLRVHEFIKDDFIEKLWLELAVQIFRKHGFEFEVLKVAIAVGISSLQKVNEELARLLQLGLHHVDHDCSHSNVDLLDELVDDEDGSRALLVSISGSTLLFVPGELVEDRIDFLLEKVEIVVFFLCGGSARITVGCLSGSGIRCTPQLILNLLLELGLSKS